MQELTFDATLALILAKDARYQRDAYLFVKDALDYTHKVVEKEKRETRRHVSGQELLEGIRTFALNQYGPMADTVLAEWGVHCCEDFGEIVFNMVDIGLLGKTEEDRREDFQNGYAFHDAFRKPFLPSAKLRDREGVSKPTEA